MPEPVIKSAQGTEDKPVTVMTAQSCVVTNLFEITCLPTMPVVKHAQGALAEDKPVTIVMTHLRLHVYLQCQS
jgi:hypothetical protein